MVDMERRKVIAKTIQGIFNGKPKFIRHWDDNNSSYVDMLYSIDSPNKGTNSYSTVGLSEYSIGYNVEEIPLCIEILGVCASEHELFPNILATCALSIINSKFSCYPGAIFYNVVNMYIPNCSMKHILFVPPFIWEDEIKTLEFSDKKVAWLLGIPISEEESILAERKGVDALENLFEKQQIDIADLGRRSII